MKVEFLVRGENRCPLLRKKNILGQSREVPYHNLHDIKPRIEPEAHRLLRNMECNSSHHKDNSASQRARFIAGPMQENVLYPWCWWCKCFRPCVGWCFFFAYFCPWRSLRLNRISKIQKNPFNYSRNLIYLWVKIEQLFLLSFLSL